MCLFCRGILCVLFLCSLILLVLHYFILFSYITYLRCRFVGFLVVENKVNAKHATGVDRGAQGTQPSPNGQAKKEFFVKIGGLSSFT